MAYGWLDAWMAWWGGKTLIGTTLWGIPILWWGRIGKLMQFLGGLTVVLDLIGPERLLAIARRTSELPRSMLSAGPWMELRAADRPTRHHGHSLVDVTPTFSAAFVVVAGIGVLLWLYVPFESIYVVAWLAWGLIAVPTFAMFAGLVTTWGVYALICLPPVFYFLLIGAPSYLAYRLIGRDSQAHPARWIAFILFVIGFQFDLLAS